MGWGEGARSGPWGHYRQLANPSVPMIGYEPRRRRLEEAREARAHRRRARALKELDLALEGKGPGLIPPGLRADPVAFLRSLGPRLLTLLERSLPDEMEDERKGLSRWTCDGARRPSRPEDAPEFWAGVCSRIAVLVDLMSDADQDVIVFDRTPARQGAQSPTGGWCKLREQGVRLADGVLEEAFDKVCDATGFYLPQSFEFFLEEYALTCETMTVEVDRGEGEGPQTWFQVRVPGERLLKLWNYQPLQRAIETARCLVRQLQ